MKLFFVESLSGVIGWSLAAPLFSVNLVLLTALIEKSVAPLRRLFTAGGLVGVGEQALRVQRWGLWMAPVIYSFLRLSPEPTWYDQDGAVRSVDRRAARADPRSGRLPPLEPRRLPRPARVRLAARPDLVRSHGPARRDARESLLRRRRRARRTAARFVGHRLAGTRDSGGHPALRHLGAPADPLLHSARRRLGLRLGRAPRRCARRDGPLSAPVSSVLLGYSLRSSRSALAVAIVLGREAIAAARGDGSIRLVTRTWRAPTRAISSSPMAPTRSSSRATVSASAAS